MQINNINILFFGTGEFAVPILKNLIDNNYKIVSVVTQPDKPVGREQILTPTPIKKYTKKYGIKIQQPANLKTFDFGLLTFDLIIAADYGKIIPKTLLESAEYGALNVHPSLLPKYRGPSPIQTAILNGDKETGVSIMLMDEKMDHGAILAQEKISLEDEHFQLNKITTSALVDKASIIGANLLIKIIPLWINEEITPIPKDEKKSTYTKIIEKKDGKIDWNKSAIEIERQIRAYSPKIYCFSFLPNGKRIKIIETAIYFPPCQGRIKGGMPGTIIKTENKKMAVKCGHGYLEIKKIQMEGKKETTSENFLNGYADFIGKILK